MMKSLVDIATSGASPEIVMELMAKQLEKRLQALEQGNHQDATDKLLQSVLEALKGMKTTVDVKPAKVEVAAPVVNFTPGPVQVLEKEEKKIKITVERGLSGSIESLTVVKG